MTYGKTTHRKPFLVHKAFYWLYAAGIFDKGLSCVGISSISFLVQIWNMLITFVFLYLKISNVT